MSKSKTVIINFSVPESYKDRMEGYCKNKDLSRSELLRRWIDENIDPVPQQ